MSEHEQLHLVVAKNIRLRRESIPLSQEALADICGLHRTYIGAIERGERNVTVNTLARVAEALGCSAIDLLSPQNPNKKQKL
jgi:transcriptional regulator with XRE-family HTH domain